MNTESKQLLLRDLCARLRYGVKVKIYDKEILNYGEGEIGIIDGKEVSEDDYFTIKAKTDRWIISIDEFKPYLRPMSSMTEEEKKKLKEDTCPKGTGYFDDKYLICPINHYGEHISYEFMSAILEWLNAHHFDYCGLIEKGLALEAPEGMYDTGIN